MKNALINAIIRIWMDICAQTNMLTVVTDNQAITITSLLHVIRFLSSFCNLIFYIKIIKTLKLTRTINEIILLT